MTTDAQITRTEHIEIAEIITVAGVEYTRVADPLPEPMSSERVRDLFEDAQYETRAYSGRAMYGEHCLAVTTDSPSEAATVILDVVQACAENGTVEEVLELVSMLRGSRTDSMGRGCVVYWPDIKVADESEEEEYESRGGRGDREDFHSDG
jgi:hypothetical protein